MTTDTVSTIRTWNTLGIYWLQCLAVAKQVDLIPPHLFTRTTVYRVEPGSLDVHSAPLIAIMGSDTVPNARKWQLMKHFAAGLRYAFLNDKPVTSVRIETQYPDPSLLFEQPSGECWQLARRNTRVDSAGHPIVIQGGDPCTWFEMSRWRDMRPYTENPGEGGYALSAPRFWETRFDQTLSAIGATQLSKNLWAPPLATSTDDLHHYLKDVHDPGFQTNGFRPRAACGEK
jgi:hypothetical protein